MVWGLAGRLVLLASVVLLASAALSCTASVSANGNTVEILRTVEGSYEVVVGVLPERPTVGVVHFSIAPLDAGARLPVTDAQVLIVANDEQGVPTYQAPALNTPSAPQYYDANITFESPGTWNLVIDVRSPKLGAARIELPFHVESQALPPGLQGTIVWLVLLAVLFAGTAYVWSTARRRDSGSQV